MRSAFEMSTWGGDRREHDNGVTCYAFTMEGRLCLRANSLIAYCEANRVVWSILYFIDFHLSLKISQCMISLYHMMTPMVQKNK